MEISSTIYAWTNQSFIDLDVEHEGKDYALQLTQDAHNLYVYDISDEDGPIEDGELFEKIEQFAIQALQSTHEQQYIRALNNVIHEG